MQRWEYASVRWDAAERRTYLLLPGRDEEHQKGIDFFEVVQSLGEEGWEAFSHVLNGPSQEILLKRPKE